MARRQGTTPASRAPGEARAQSHVRFIARRRAARLALSAAVAISAAASAEDRFALTSAEVSDDRIAASRAFPPADPLDADAASGYRLIGEFLGGADTIFANGFDFNAAWDATFPSNVTIDTNGVVLASIAVPAGSYVAIARLQARTGDEPNPGNNYRFDCNLAPDFDFGVYRVGVEPLVERYMTWQGAATLDSPGIIQFTCSDGNGHVDTGLSGKLTVISVGTVN